MAVGLCQRRCVRRLVSLRSLVCFVFCPLMQFQVTAHTIAVITYSWSAVSACQSLPEGMWCYTLECAWKLRGSLD